MKMFKVSSESSPGRTYVVRHDEYTDLWYCNCASFLFRERRIKECKHIVKAKKQRSKEVVSNGV